MSGRAPTLLLLLALLVAAAAISLALGSAERATADIVLQIRLPRVLLGALVGAGVVTRAVTPGANCGPDSAEG